MLSELRARKLRAFFRANDHNGDGVLERADYEAIVARLLALRGLEESSADAVALRNGYMVLWNYLPTADLDVDRFLAACDTVLVPSAAADLWSRSVAEQVFGILDEDGDGLISLEEFRRYSLAHRIEPQHIEDTFRRLDLAGRSQLSVAEWVTISRDFLFSDDPDSAGNWLWGPY